MACQVMEFIRAANVITIVSPIRAVMRAFSSLLNEPWQEACVRVPTGECLNVLSSQPLSAEDVHVSDWWHEFRWPFSSAWCHE